MDSVETAFFLIDRTKHCAIPSVCEQIKALED